MFQKYLQGCFKSFIYFLQENIFNIRLYNQVWKIKEYEQLPPEHFVFIIATLYIYIQYSFGCNALMFWA